MVETQDETITFYYSKEPLIKINKSAFNKRLLYNSIIVDSNAIKYQVQTVENLGYTNVFGGLNIFLERTIYVKIVLRKIKKLDLVEFKMMAFSVIDKNSDDYISAGKDIEDLKKQIECLTNTVEIMNLLSH